MPYDKYKNYSRVTMIGGRKAPAEEINDLQDILRGYINTLTCYASTKNGNAGQDGWKVTVSATGINSIDILPGMFIIDGNQIINEDITNYTGLTTPVAPRTDYVWVVLDKLEYSYLNDGTLIIDPALGATANRSIYKVNFTVVEGSTTPPIIPANGYVFCIASISRLAGNANITDTMITDLRFANSINYIETGLDFYRNSALNFDIIAGSFMVANTRYWYTASNHNAGVGTVYYWLNSVGTLTTGAALPDEFTENYIPLFKITADAVTITGFEDLRIFVAGGYNVNREVFAARGAFDSLDEALGLRGTATFASTTGVFIDTSGNITRNPAGYGYTVDIHPIGTALISVDPTIGDIWVVNGNINVGFTVYNNGSNNYSTFEWCVRQYRT